MKKLLDGKRSLQEFLFVCCMRNRCFKIFDVIHMVITTRASLERITREFIEDCVRDGVVYVEIRTTPRCYTSEDMSLSLSEKEGIDVILNEMKKAEKAFQNQIVTRLVLSINRGESAYLPTSDFDLGRKRFVPPNWPFSTRLQENRMLLVLSSQETPPYSQPSALSIGCPFLLFPRSLFITQEARHSNHNSRWRGSQLQSFEFKVLLRSRRISKMSRYPGHS